GGRITPELLREAGYRNDVDGDPTHWWAPSDTPLFDPLGAPGMFYLPVGSRDPFGAVSTVRYDRFNILPVEVADALGNATSARNDYRLLLPWELTDLNGNRTQVAFDVRGLVAATAVMGREGEGDTLAEPTTRVEYDLFAYHRTRDTDRPQPNWARTRARVRHGDPTSPWHESYAYSDGLGRVVLAKVQAEDGPAPAYGPDGDLLLDAAGQPIQAHSTDRWIGTGATVFNNKGLPVRQYEPFFDSRPDYTDEATLVRIGVSPTLHYDALGRVIRTDLPDGASTRVEFDAWRQLDYDANDTVLEPGNRWYAERGTPDPDGPEPSEPGP